MLGTVVLNFVLDPLFIFGWGPVPGHGVMGAALATLVTQALAALIGMAVLLRGSHGIELSWRGLVPDPPYIKRAFLLGFPGSVELSTRGLGLVVMSFLVASFGTLTTGRLRRRLDHPASRHHSGDGPVDGGLDAGRSEHRSRQHPARLPHRPSRRRLGFGVLTLVGALAFCLRAFDRGVLRAQRCRRHRRGRDDSSASCASPGAAWAFSFASWPAFRASGNMLMAMVVALVSQWVIQFPLAYVLSKHTVLHADGLWWSFPVTNILVALVSLGWFARRLEDQAADGRGHRDGKSRRRDHHRGGPALRQALLQASIVSWVSERSFASTCSRSRRRE